MNQTTSQVVVTARELRKLIPRAEHANLESMAGDTSQETVALAGVWRALQRLEKETEEKGSEKVMVTAPDPTASLLQSAIAEGEIAPRQLEPLSTGGLEAKFDERDWIGWATVAWEKIKHPVPHPLDKPERNDAAPFPDAGRVALLGDWGTGLYGAPIIGRTIQNDPEPYAMLMHLGDVYYSGSKQEVKQRFLDLWPKRPEAINRALNSNHEMYSGGYAYFEQTLPEFQQDASYFALQNKHWTLIGLDVAHSDHAINEQRYKDQQVNWLKGILAKAGDRKVIFFSHHQLFSQFDSQGDKLWGDPAFAEILRSGRIFAWYWGHEHRCCIYEERDPRSGIWGRCMGHGGMPESRKKTQGLEKASGFDRADWRRIGRTRDENGNVVPSALILEGSNPYLGDEADKFMPHGYGTLVFDGPRLREEVRDCEGRVIYVRDLGS